MEVGKQGAESLVLQAKKHSYSTLNLEICQLDVLILHYRIVVVTNIDQSI